MSATVLLRSAVVFILLSGMVGGKKRLVCDQYGPDPSPVEKCKGNFPPWYCFALWDTLPNGSIFLIMKGCMLITDLGSDELNNLHPNNKPDCVETPENLECKAGMNFKMCCCTGDHCNRYINGDGPAEMTVEPSTSGYLEPNSSGYLVNTSNERIVNGSANKNETMSVILVNKKLNKGGMPAQQIVLIVLAPIIIIIPCILLLLHCYRRCFRTDKQLNESTQPPKEHEIFVGADLSQFNILGRGRYAEVLKGKLGNKDVAVKVYSEQYSEYWQKEKDLHFTIGHHPRIVELFSAGIHKENDLIKHLLVTEYCPHGSLASYLKQTIISFEEMITLSSSAAAGLAYLHNEDDKVAFAHRDICSNNILVRLDGTCVLSDFQFAMNLSNLRDQPITYHSAVEKQEAVVGSHRITEVAGTLRYKAPELLESYINLAYSRVSLMQIDIYALALVLWEILTRCQDVYGDQPVPEYRPPFDLELGPVTSKNMLDKVVAQGLRPTFPDAPYSNQSGLWLLREVIENSWDADPEARLSAANILLSLKSLQVAPTAPPMEAVANVTSEAASPEAAAELSDVIVEVEVHVTPRRVHFTQHLLEHSTRC